MRYSAGFTFVEFMLSIAMFGAMLVMGAYGFQTILYNNQSVSGTSNFSTTLRYASSEAIKRGEVVSVCAAASNKFEACGKLGDWGNGWITFLDENSDGKLDSSADRLSIHQAMPATVTVEANRSFLCFNGIGAQIAGDFTLKVYGTQCTGKNVRVVRVGELGRAITYYEDCP